MVLFSVINEISLMVNRIRRRWITFVRILYPEFRSMMDNREEITWNYSNNLNRNLINKLDR